MASLEEAGDKRRGRLVASQVSGEAREAVHLANRWSEEEGSRDQGGEVYSQFWSVRERQKPSGNAGSAVIYGQYTKIIINGGPS